MSEPEDAPEPAAPNEAPDEATEAGAIQAETRAARQPKRRKQRKQPGAGEASEPAAPRARRAPLDAQGRERPAFVLDFPHDPELEALITAFERGDYARVRVEAPALAERTTDDEVRAAALELRRRIDPEPLMKYLVVIALALLGFLTLWAYGKSAH